MPVIHLENKVIGTRIYKINERMDFSRHLGIKLDIDGARGSRKAYTLDIYLYKYVLVFFLHRR